MTPMTYTGPGSEPALDPDGCEIPLLKISWSGLKRWENCAHLHYRAMRGEAQKTDRRVFFPGTLADRVMRSWLEEADPQPGGMVERLPEMFESLQNGEEREAQIRWRGNAKKDKQEVFNNVYAALTRLEPWLNEHVLPFEYHPELKFRTEVLLPHPSGVKAPVQLNGGIDIAVRREKDPDVYFLHDLKLSKNPQYISSTLGQSIFYDVAFSHWIGLPGQPQFFSFVAPMLDPMEIPAAINNDDRRILLTKVVKMAQSIWSGDIAPKDDDAGCKWCDARNVCPKFDVGAMKDTQGKNRASFALAKEARRGVPQDNDPNMDLEDA